MSLASASTQQEVDVDLTIIGAGYAGINAFNAACHYLKKGARVAVVDPRNTWGGQWVEQYDYVRLHQSHKQYTAGERTWNIGKPWHHLASKQEILRHFTEIAKSCESENNLDMLELFYHEYVDHIVVDEKDYVEVNVVPVGPAEVLQTLPYKSLKIRSKKLIKALGFQTPIKQPFNFSTPARVHCLAPKDLASPEWQAKMRFQDTDTPIYVIGSGKTGLDTINYMSKHEHLRDRVRCIAGNGTLFLNRSRTEPQGFFQRNMYGNDNILTVATDICAGFDGSNGAKLLKHLEKRNLVHSPITDSKHFLVGNASEEEVKCARAVLAPQSKKVHKSHLIDVVQEKVQDDQEKEEEMKLFMKLRDCATGKEYKKEIPVGSFIINCTDHLLPEILTSWEPIMSGNGRVLCPQYACGFTGPSANYCTHLWYLNRLEPLWRELPRYNEYHGNKDNFGLVLFMIVMLNSEALVRAFPGNVGRRYSPVIDSIPLHRAIPSLLRFNSLYPKFQEKLRKFVTGRYTDIPGEAPPQPQILAGNIGVDAVYPVLPSRL